MGALGSDAAIEAADIVIMTDDLSKIETAIKISKKTMRIVKRNIVFSIVVKIHVASGICRCRCFNTCSNKCRFRDVC